MGMSVEEQASGVDGRICFRCHRHRRREEFPCDRSRPGGFGYECRECRNARQAATYKPVPRDMRRTPGPQRIPRRDGDKKQARSRINHDVQRGARPSPNELPCFDCGHVGTDRRHEYDHFLGYAAERHYDVQAVCSSCHHRRERDRRNGDPVRLKHKKGEDTTEWPEHLRVQQWPR